MKSYLIFFAGSGTTGHAVINYNRNKELEESNVCSLKYILIEMGEYFDDVTKQRLKKSSIYW